MFSVLFLSDKAEIVNPPNRTIVIENNFATLSCTAQGDKTVTIKWWKNSTEINPHQHSRIIVENRVIEQGDNDNLYKISSKLEMMPALVEDNGNYICQAINGYGIDSRQADLIVQSE